MELNPINFIKTSSEGFDSPRKENALFPKRIRYTPKNAEAFNRIITQNPKNCSLIATPISYTSTHRRNFSDFSTQFFGTEVDFYRRDFNKLIDECNNLQSNLVSTWEELRKTVKSRSNSMIEIKYDQNLIKNPELVKAKERAELLKTGMTYNEKCERLRKVQSILRISQKTNPIQRIKKVNSETDLLNRKRDYVTLDDLSNVLTAKLLATNKRQFGSMFEANVKVSGSSKPGSPKKMPVSNTICPESTVLEDIKLYRKQETQLYKPSSQIRITITEDVHEKFDEDSVFDRLEGSSPKHKIVAKKAIDETPAKRSNLINRKKRNVIKKKIENYNEVLKNLKLSHSRPLSAKGKVDDRMPIRVSQLSGKMTSRKKVMTEDDILKIIRKQFDDVETKAKIQKLTKPKNKVYWGSSNKFWRIFLPINFKCLTNDMR